jgi:outer membrane protein OmpA-like peptidoglycan-associated protein
MSQESTAPARDSGRTALTELRTLLLAPEQEDIRQLRESIEGAQSAEEISRLLPEAVRLAAQRNWKLESALRPVIEQSIGVSVRRDPSILSSVLAPLIGDMVKRAVVSALRQLAESIQQTMEQSLSWRGVLWRMEAVRTGRPYGEIVLVHSLLYRVDQVFLIHRETGSLLAQASREPDASMNGDLISAMLTAIQDFVKDSFGGPAGNAVEIIEAGVFVIWVQQSPQAILAALIRGVPPKALKTVFESVLDRICCSHAGAIARFNGDVSSFQSCREELAGCFLGQGKMARRRVFWPLWALAAMIAIAIAGFVYWQLYQARRWQHFVDALRREPGIVITESSRRGGKYFLSGLRDPLARDPAVLSNQAGFSARDVNFDWQTYISAQQPLVAIRDFADAKKQVEARRIHFPTDRSEVSLEQLGAVEDAAQDINILVGRASRVGKKIKIEVVGHADDSGKEERSAELSDLRAAEVAALLRSAGVPSRELYTTRASAAESKSTGNGDQKRALDRNVSFSVHAN